MKLGKPDHSFSGNKSYIIFPLREEKILSPQRKCIALAKRIVCLREGNDEHNHRMEQMPCKSLSKALYNCKSKTRKTCQAAKM